MDAICDALHDAGHTTWLDRRSIRAGDAWQLAIGRGIADADAFVALVWRRALDSKWVLRELATATDH